MSQFPEALLETLDRLRSLPRESATVEFKSNLDHSNEIGQYISALANSAVLDGHDRAWIAWGIEDGTHDVKGTTFDPFSRKEGHQALIMWLQQMTSPRADFEFHTVNHQGAYHKAGESDTLGASAAGRGRGGAFSVAGRCQDQLDFAGQLQSH